MILLTLYFLAKTVTATPLASEILGVWQYDGFFYDQHRYPNPNPNLVLRFTFTEEGQAVLRWDRNDGQGVCERRASYRVDGNILWQKVIWVSPSNGPQCAQDPDMQMGRETQDPIIIESQELRFVLKLNDRDFLYILKSVSAAESRF